MTCANDVWKTGYLSVLFFKWHENVNNLLVGWFLSPFSLCRVWTKVYYSNLWDTSEIYTLLFGLSSSWRMEHNWGLFAILSKLCTKFLVESVLVTLPCDQWWVVLVQSRKKKERRFPSTGVNWLSNYSGWFHSSVINPLRSTGSYGPVRGISDALKVGFQAASNPDFFCSK